MKHDIKTTVQLGKWIELRKLDYEKVEKDILKCIKGIEKDLEKGVELKGIFRAIHRIVDEIIKKEPKTQELSCKKGCSFCCKTSVDISPVEAQIIGDYCKYRGIPIPKEYLESQLQFNEKEISLTPVAACVFLNSSNGCGIYKIRPLACRKYYVASDPKYCDCTVYKPPNNGVAVHFSYETEVILSALITLYPESGRMPELLLQYLKQNEHE